MIGGQGIRRIVVLLPGLILSFFLGVWGGATQDREPVAVVANARGGANFRPRDARAWGPLHFFSELYSGDRIRVRKESEVRMVYYHDAHSEILRGECQVRISFRGGVLEKGLRRSLVRRASYAGIRALKPIHAARQRFGGSATRSPRMTPVLITPLGAIRSLRPEFRWEPFALARDYRVILKDDRGNTLWEIASPNPILPFPEQHQPLEFGKRYLWSVTVSGDEGILESHLGEFWTLSEAGYKRLKSLEEQTRLQVEKNPGDSTPHMVLLATYLQEGLFPEAYQTCLTILRMNPGNPAARIYLEELNQRLLLERGKNSKN